MAQIFGGFRSADHGDRGHHRDGEDKNRHEHRRDHEDRRRRRDTSENGDW